MLPEIMGYRRPDGRFGIRNHIAVIATMDNANPTVRRICSLVKGCVPFCPGFGRGEMNEDLALTAEYISGEIAKGGKPVVGFSIEDQGGTVEVAYRAAQAAIQMLHDAGRLRPEPMPWSEFVLGVECGGSDGSSGIVSNPVTGRLADRVIDAGGTVIMSETLELLGGEEMLGRRAVTPEVAAKVKGIIQRTLDYAAEHNLDIMGANPAPDNIAGGLTTIEEKALGAIKKGGTRPLVEVLEEGERPTKKGFVIMDAPAPGVENLTAIVPRRHLLHRQGQLHRPSRGPRHQDLRQSHDREVHARQYRRRRVRRHQSGAHPRSGHRYRAGQAGGRVLGRHDQLRHAGRDRNGRQPPFENPVSQRMP